MKRLSFLTAACVLLFSALPVVQAAPEDPAHNELRALRTQVIEAITKGDIDAVVAHVHPNVVVTWQNAEVCRGAAGLREFFERMGKKTFKGYKVPPTPDDLTQLYGGDTGVSFGSVVGQYTLLGKELEFKSRWTATLVKENGKWLLASYHVSFNALDNPLLNAAEKSLIWVAAGTGVLGLLIGLFFGRRKQAA
ncbi:MAG: nuclear transport factor 2 family protein [Opitutaceae bacterium]|nr:nuclear transport factor 2 family protein [Opitutaceae bacterium]